MVSVCNLSKNTIWKQITTASIVTSTTSILYAIYQRTQSESKSQPLNTAKYPSISVCNLSKNTIWKQITTRYDKNEEYWLCMQSIKEHNLKANHNYVSILFNINALYAIYQRTQSESKSQPALAMSYIAEICMQSIKEHNLKANHNTDQNEQPKMILYAIYQRTQSESKSQPITA